MLMKTDTQPQPDGSILITATSAKFGNPLGSAVLRESMPTMFHAEFSPEVQHACPARTALITIARQRATEHGKGLSFVEDLPTKRTAAKGKPGTA